MFVISASSCREADFIALLERALFQEKWKLIVMATGKIKWFDSNTGYGFIHPNSGSEDVFFHRSALLEASGHKLQKGDEVSFKTEANPRGPEATTITLLNVTPNLLLSEPKE
jgi:cold shock protein